MANLFKCWVKYKVVDQTKVSHECNDIDEGLELGKQKIIKGLRAFRCPKFRRNLREEHKKGLDLINSQLSANRQFGVNSK